MTVIATDFVDHDLGSLTWCDRKTSIAWSLHGLHSLFIVSVCTHWLQCFRVCFPGGVFRVCLFGCVFPGGFSGVLFRGVFPGGLSGWSYPGGLLGALSGWTFRVDDPGGRKGI